MNNRWWTYQKERFPLVAHGPMVIVFCLSAMLFSSLQTGELPELPRIIAAAVSTIILFFQLRVADEFKDFDADARYRPHRPVPRGLVSLRELARLAWFGAAVQFIIAVTIDVGLVPLLLGVWLYIGLMTKEFFVAEWLKRNPSVYLASHMIVMPLIAFYAGAFDWLCNCRELPAGLGWFLLLSFTCGLVLELGRKIRMPAAEQEGVETYSALWGMRKSVALWLIFATISVAAFSKAATFVGTNIPVAIVALAAMSIAVFIALSFPADEQRPAGARLIEPGSAAVATLLYLGLGPLHAIVA